MNDELINFKGMADGVRIHLNNTSPMFEVLDALEEKINSHKVFFGDGNCRICFDGRTLTGGEKERLIRLVERLLPLARIEFETPKKHARPSDEWITEYKERHGVRGEDKTPPAVEESIAEEEKKPEGSTMAEEVMKHIQGKPDEEEFLSVFRSNRARLYHGFVHEGMTMSSDGHLILLGSVDKGGSLIAAGNIIVIGGLYGNAHAGCNGHNGSYIIAMDMLPQRLSIAAAAEEYVYPEVSEHTEQQEEHIKRGFFEKFKKKPEQQEKNINRTEKSAVALWKNNKIVLDNFTIQTFTNLKNMI